MFFPDKTRKLGFARHERQAREITAVAMEEIEDVIDEPLALARFERSLQPREGGNAVRVLDYDFAIDQRGARRQLRDGGGEVRKFGRPVEPLAGQQPNVAVREAGLDAIAVELDFVHPAPAARRRGAQSRQRWRHEGRERRAMRPGFLLALRAALLGASSRHGHTTWGGR